MPRLKPLTPLLRSARALPFDVETQRISAYQTAEGIVAGDHRFKGALIPQRRLYYLASKVLAQRDEITQLKARNEQLEHQLRRTPNLSTELQMLRERYSALYEAHRKMKKRRSKETP